MSTNSLVQWFSSGKPLTAICIAQLYEAGELLLDDHVGRYIPEFAKNGKEEINVWHVLTHTGGLGPADSVPRRVEWKEAIKFICDSPIESDWIPGKKAAYSPQAGWFLLAEIVQRITGRTFPDYLRAEVLQPLGMNDSWISLPPETFIGYGERVAQMFETSAGTRRLAPLQDANGMAICRPGASARGPVRELARFYTMLLNRGELEGRRFLRADTIDLFTRRHREGLFDHTFMHTLDYGLGFIVNSNRYGAETVPYGYGRYASEETFGHSGAQSSCAFVDAKNRLVVAWVASGMCGERLHQKRQRDVNHAIYEHLGRG